MRSAHDLRDRLKDLNLHGEAGSFSWSEKVQSYIEQLADYCQSFDITPNKLFVGRQEDLHKVLQILTKEKKGKFISLI